ncbi:DUF3299 domain-containing protein [Sphingomonas bacterium]|uniref:DUF3299 domain-containing protein n=1 Tax=Sphingomonas bacterium TaxID=1895847 RepID=UPI00157698FF|nr:DUF3299 domain-containing protein [Sphingomonas bacterium]
MKIMKALSAVFLGLLVGQPCSALAVSVGSTQQWGPHGNGLLAHRDDVRWLDLHDAKVTADTAAGIYTARFGPILQQMDNQDFVITGFMMPVGVDLASTHFVLTRRSATCPFCPPNEPTEAIEVFSDKFVKYTDAPITVSGKLQLVANSDRGLFYRLKSAKIF